jgi:hypothetical protein
MSRSALESTLFPQPDLAVLEKFRSLNPQLSQYAKPGHLIVLSDPRNTQCTREEALLMEAAQKVDAAFEPLSDAEAEFVSRHHEEIGSFLSQGSTGVGIGSAMFATHLGNLKDILVDIESLHKRTFDKHGKLRGAEFFAERKMLMGRLDSNLGPLVRKGVGIPNHPKLKSALGISNRSLVHHWSKAGIAGGIPGYATHIDGVSKAGRVMKVGGLVGIAIGASASGLKVKETCRIGTEVACRKVRFSEGGKLAGAVGGSMVGGALGSLVCVGIGFVTAGAGVVGCSLVLVGVGTLGGGVGGEVAGGKFGEVIYEGMYE